MKENKEELEEQKLETVDNQPPVEYQVELSDLENVKLELAGQKEKYIRLYSEFENFRRRTAKEKIETIMNASENLIKELLPVMDDFERAEKFIQSTEDLDSVKEGISLIFNKLLKMLESKGLKPIEAKSKDFDVELHECITQFDGGEENKGKVIDEVEKGYFLNDKVVRYSKVVVGS